MIKLLRVFFIVIITVTSCANAVAPNMKPVILTSVSPIADIVRMLIGDAAEIVALNDTAGCPHDYHLRPSDSIKIQKADIVIYIDEKFDGFMSKIMPRAKGQVVRLSDYPELGLSSKNNNWHLWLDLAKLQLLGEILQTLLQEKYPALRALIEQNKIKLEKELGALKIRKSQVIGMMKSVPIITHDSFESFFADTIFAEKLVKLYIAENNSSLKDYVKIQNIVAVYPEAYIFIDEHQQNILAPLYGKFTDKFIIMDVENLHHHSINQWAFIKNYTKLLELLLVNFR